MKMYLTCAAGLVALTVGATAIPAKAQNSPADPGQYVEMSMIDVADGGGMQYMTYLANEWRKNQEFAKSKGWITDYSVLGNINARPGEPDLYLSVTFPSMVDAAEQLRRQTAWRDHMKKSDTQLGAESGDRSKYRTVMGSMLMQQIVFKK